MLLILVLLRSGAAAGQVVAPEVGDALILADPADPYYALAEEIAQQEALTMVHTLDEVIARRPTYLLWVVSPSRLSDPALVGLSLAIRDHPRPMATGIISGSTLEQARALWRRASEGVVPARAERTYAVNAPNPAANIFAGRIISAHPAGQIQPLTLSGLRDVLAQADYVTFTGHGSSRYWRLDEELRFDSQDIPALDAAVVSSGACQTFRPWEASSIALRFVDQGAAAYAGFVFSPNEGYLIGAFEGFPFRYTWPAVPIGLAVQVQNRGARRGFARIPYYYLLGDPRIALQQEIPYQVQEDTVRGDTRRIHYADLPVGVIPLRVPGGAAYRFVEAIGETATLERDPFYNSRLQMIDLGADKIILFEHHGGDLTLRLRRRAPALRVVIDGVFDVLDHALLFNVQAGSIVALLILGGLATLGAGWRAWRKRLSSRQLLIAAGIALAFTGLHALYALVRRDHVTITSKPLTLPPSALLATFLLVGSGALLHLAARSHRGRAFAIAVMCSPSLLGAGITFLACAVVNIAAIGQFGAGIMNYNLTIMNALAFLLQAPILAFIYAVCLPNPQA